MPVGPADGRRAVGMDDTGAVVVEVEVVVEVVDDDAVEVDAAVDVAAVDAGVDAAEDASVFACASAEPAASLAGLLSAASVAQEFAAALPMMAAAAATLTTLPASRRGCRDHNTRQLGGPGTSRPRCAGTPRHSRPWRGAVCGKPNRPASQGNTSLR